MLATVDRPNTLIALPTQRRRPVTTELPAAPSREHNLAGTDRADVLRIISDPRTPTYVTEYANGRRRYSYWRPVDPTGTGGCYASLPTAECDALHAAGRIALGEPVVDPNRTTYRVRPAARPQPATRPEPAPRTSFEPIRTPRERARVA